MLKYLIFVMSLLAIFYGLFRSDAPPELFKNSDLIGHFIAFLVLCISGFIALPARASYAFFCLLLVFSGIAENLQAALTPVRVFSLLDTQANIAGALLGVLFCFSYRRYQLRQSRVSFKNS